jgi:hypothetical protein
LDNSSGPYLNLEMTAVIKRNLRAKFPHLKFSATELVELTALADEQALCNLAQARRGLDLANQWAAEQEKLGYLQNSFYETRERLDLAQRQSTLFPGEGNQVEIAAITQELLALEKKIQIQTLKAQKARAEERVQDKTYSAAHDRAEVMISHLVARHPKWLEIFQADLNPLDLVAEREDS